MKPFTYRRTLILGFGFLGISIVWPIFNRFVPIFLQAGNPEYERILLESGREVPAVVGLGLGPGLALFIMTWDNLINVFVQPWVGNRSDRTWNRFGRRKPWLLLGVPIAMAGFVLVPLAQSLLAIAVFILITNFGMALFRSPTVAWLGDLFEPDDRSRANGVINLMGGVGFVLAQFGGGFLFDAYGREAPFIGGAILVVAAVAVVLLKIQEPRYLGDVETEAATVVALRASLRAVWTRADKSLLLVLLGILFWFIAFEALDTGLSSFAVFTLGLPAGRASMLASAAGLSFLLMAIPAGNLGSRYGRRRVIQVGLAGLVLVLLLAFVIIQDQVTFVICLLLVGICWALVNINSLPLVYDHGDERQIGTFTGLYYFASQSAAVIGPTGGGFLVEAMGYDYRWLFLFSPIFMALAWLVLLGVKARSNN